MHPPSRLAAVLVAGWALAAGAGARAQNTLAEDFTAGPASWNGGTPFYGNSLDGEFELEPDRWYLHGTFLLNTDALRTVHQNYQLGGSWQPSDVLEIGAFGFVSPHASGQEVVPVPTGPILVNHLDVLGSAAIGADAYGSYEIVKGRKGLTLLGEVNYSHYDIDQQLYENVGIVGRIKTFTGNLNQVSFSLGASGRLGNSRLTLSGTYYVYDQDPNTVGQITNARGLLVTVGGLSTGSLGLPTAPMTWNAVVGFRQRFGDLILYFTYAFLDYVDPNGTGNVFTFKVAYDFSDWLRVYVGDTIQADSAYNPSGQPSAPGQTPAVSNLILTGLLLTFY
jgi:hypothetical protein